MLFMCTGIFIYLPQSSLPCGDSWSTEPVKCVSAYMCVFVCLCVCQRGLINLLLSPLVDVGMHGVKEGHDS